MSKKQSSVEDIELYLRKILAAYQANDLLSNQIIGSFSEDKISAVRLNSLRADITESKNLIESHGVTLEHVTWSKCSFLVDDKTKLSRLTESRDGIFYIQNLSSQLTAIILNPQAENFILDLAAAPGGKTSFIAQLMNNQGKISAVEPVKDRYYRLIANLKSLGVTIARCYNKDGRVVGKICSEWFDQVLLDAPCSSMAQIDFRNPDSYAHWNYKKVKECSRKQKHLIESAFNSLKPGCDMIYSTCSWMVEENEEVVDHLLKMFPEQVEVLPIDLPIDNFFHGLVDYSGTNFDSSVSKTVRIIPNKYFEAFYIAKLRKKVI